MLSIDTKKVVSQFSLAKKTGSYLLLAENTHIIFYN